MNVRMEFENYISTNEKNGALLLTGKWGCGKTHFIKQIADELNSKDNTLMVVISLFGIETIDSLHQTVKKSVFFAKGFEEHGEVIKNSFSKLKERAMTIVNAVSEYSKIAKGVNAALSINWQDFFDVEKNIQCTHEGKKVEKTLVLIFDDFERNQIDSIKLMGAINEYCENKGIKVVIVADEEHINNNKYSEFKEKLISRTVKLTPNYDETIKSIIYSYNEKEPGYKDFLECNLRIIQKLFYESKTENLRSLKSLLVDFERVFGAWRKTDVPANLQSKVLYMFGSMLFTVKSDKYVEGEYGDLFVDSDIKKKYSYWEETYKLSTLKNWVVNGIWVESDFIEEINLRFKIDDMSDEQKFLRCSFWDLEQGIIDNGMPVAVEDAYRGDLSRDEIIDLLQKVFILKKYDIPLPCDVDYSRIQDGFNVRKRKILSFEVTEPKRHGFSQRDQIEKEAYSLYNDIEQFDKRMIAINNKKTLVEFLKDSSERPNFRFDGLIIGSLDSELMNLCFEKYCSANNAQKRDLARLVLNLGFTDKYYITSDEFNETIISLTELKRKLNDYKKGITDYITLININEYTKEIDHLINKINTCISAKE